jgi:hypothetical protein
MSAPKTLIDVRSAGGPLDKEHDQKLTSTLDQDLTSALNQSSIMSVGPGP